MKLKKTILSVVACAIALVMTLAITACNPTEEPTEATVTAIELLATAEIDTGETKNVISLITYSNGETKKLSDSTIEWKSSNETVATVNRGVVTGKAKGTTEITASIGEVTSNKCTVTVHSLELIIAGEGVEDGAVTIDMGNTLQLSATVKKDGVAVENAEIAWTTSAAAFVTVSEDGLITALNPGAATITATYNDNRTEKVEVTVRELAGAAKMTDKEQNKAEANAWGYWYDQGWNWANTTVEKGAVYTEPYNEPAGDGYIGAGKVNITFTIDSYQWENEEGNSLDPAAIQLFYRSAGEEGKLLTNHNYEVTLKLETTASGKVSLNDYSKLPANPKEGVEVGEITEGEDYSCDFEVEAGKVNTLTVQFRHGDTGAIYADQKYSNVESAIQLCLGMLGRKGGDPVKVTVYDISYRDLGAATKEWQDNPENLPGYVDPDAPVIPEDPAVMSLADSPKATGVTLTVEDGKAILNLAGTVDLSKFDNKEAAVAWLTATHFDAQIAGGDWKLVQFNRVATVDEDAGTFLIKYDITRLAVSTGNGSGAYGCHFTQKETSEDGYNDNHYRDLKLGKDAAVPGASITVGTKTYSIVNYQAGEDFTASQENDWGQAYNYGCVAIKVEAVTAEAE